MVFCANKEVPLYSLTSLVEAANVLGVEVPSEFICPITLEVMDHPVMVRTTGLRFEQTAIVEWIQQQQYHAPSTAPKCPLTRTVLRLQDLMLDKSMKNKIEFWIWTNEIELMLQPPRRNYDDDDDDDDIDYDDDKVTSFLYLKSPRTKETKCNPAFNSQSWPHVIERL